MIKKTKFLTIYLLSTFSFTEKCFLPPPPPPHLKFLEQKISRMAGNSALENFCHRRRSVDQKKKIFTSVATIFGSLVFLG